MQKSIEQATDEEIAAMVQSGRIEPFAVLVERYGEKMKRYAKKFLFGYDDAEDQVQNVFLKSYSNIQSFDCSKKFSSWLYRIAHNEFINAIKKKKRESLPLFELDTFLPHSIGKEIVDSEANRRELRQMLDKCLSQLESKYREPLIFYYFEELSYGEIADVMRIPIATVGIRLKRGKAKMKLLYQNYEQLK